MLSDIVPIATSWCMKAAANITNNVNAICRGELTSVQKISIVAFVALASISYANASWEDNLSKEEIEEAVESGLLKPLSERLWIAAELQRLWKREECLALCQKMWLILDLSGGWSRCEQPCYNQFGGSRA